MTDGSALDRLADPVQDPREPLGGMNRGLAPLRVVPVLRLIASWRELVDQIGPQLEGAAFEQCANQLEALVFEEADVMK